MNHLLFDAFQTLLFDASDEALIVLRLMSQMNGVVSSSFLEFVLSKVVNDFPPDIFGGDPPSKLS